MGAVRNQELVKKGEGVPFRVDKQSPIPAVQSDDHQGKNIAIHTRNVFIGLNDMKRIFGFDFESANTNNPNVKSLIVKNVGEMNVKQPSDLMTITHFYVKVTVRYKTMFHKYEHLFNDYMTSYLIDFDHGKVNVIDFSYE